MQGPLSGESNAWSASGLMGALCSWNLSWVRGPSPLYEEPAPSPSRLGTQDPGLQRRELHQVASMPSTHLLPSLAGGWRGGAWRMGGAPQTSNRAPCRVRRLPLSSLLPPPPPRLVQLLASPKLYLHITSNCPSHRRMEITFHDGSSDVAIFCVDQNNKTNQTLGV